MYLWSGTGNKLTGPAASFSDALWARLHAVFSDDELVQLGLCVGAWLAFGRLNRVFGVDEACRVPIAPYGPDRLHHATG